MNQTREEFLRRHAEHAQRLDDLAGELQTLDLSEISHKVGDFTLNPVTEILAALLSVYFGAVHVYVGTVPNHTLPSLTGDRDNIFSSSASF